MHKVSRFTDSPSLTLRVLISANSRSPRRAFTLMEMVVSIAILVIVILSVGVIFQAASKAVGVSESSMEMLSNTRAINQQLEVDVSGMDKNAFLVIRSGTYTDPATGIIRRCDQISFISRGSFPNRTGAFSATPFLDNNTIAPAAFIWWGQPAFEASNGASANPLDPRSSLSTNVGTKVALNQVPTGILDSNGLLQESSFALGREVMLMVPPTGDASNSVAPTGLKVTAYPNQSAGNSNPTFTPAGCAAIDYYNTATVVGSTESAGADITQSRVAVAQCTPGLFMSYLMNGIVTAGGRSTVPRYEADHYCYRHVALRSPYDGSDIVNGYFRMHPIALQGVSSFAVEWTDGSVYSGSEIDPATGNTVAAALVGTTKWYGYQNPKSGLTSNPGVDPAGVTGAEMHGDVYCAVFSYDNPKAWPVALRFRYHVADPAGRLLSGRDFVEVVKVPN